MNDDLKAASQGRSPESLTAENKELKKTNSLNTEGSASPEPDSSDSNKPSSGWKQKLKLTWPPDKKEYFAIAVVVFFLIGVGFALLSPHQKQTVAAITKPKAAPNIPATPTSSTVPSTLSGLPVAPSVNKNPVTAVMIENSTFARPQSGLGQASVVFEAIAEGGITRFEAFFQDTAPTNVGPIRSVRPYYEQWALGFNASLAHVGGSPEALTDMKTWNVRDLDEFANGSSYHRISTRQAPHNMYTSIADLNQLEAAKGYSTSTYTGFVRKSSSTPLKSPTAGSINLTLSGPLYNVHYDYNSSTNSYERSEGGAAQTDANTNTVISPKVVIAMVMQYSLEADGYHSDYNVIGSGPVYIFQDGGVQMGTWAKTAPASQITFKTSSGQTIPLDPGQTWLTAIQDNGVSYTP